MSICSASNSSWVVIRSCNMRVKKKPGDNADPQALSSVNDQHRLRCAFAAIAGVFGVTPARVSLLLIRVCVFLLLAMLTLLSLPFTWTMLLLLVLVPILAGAHSLVALL